MIFLASQDSIKKQDLKNMEENIAKLVQRASVCDIFKVDMLD